MACIPLISTYTDCNKENLCSGCTTCKCDGGRWVCETEECHPDVPVGSRQLLVAVASLKSEVFTDDQTRSRRSINNTRGNDIETKITFEELSKWMNDTKVNIEEGKNVFVSTTTKAYPAITTTSDPDYLDFDEVLSNIAIDNNNISRKKPVLERIKGEYGDYVSFVDIVSTDNTKDEHTNKYMDKVELDTKYSNDKDSFKVDLLEGLQNKLEEQLDGKNYTAIDKEPENNFETNNYLDDTNFLSIVKRDVSQMNDSKIDKVVDNNTETIKDFKNNVLYPLIGIINEKVNELNQLMSIKNSLIELIRAMDSNFTLDEKLNNTENNKTLFSIYKLEIVPEAQVTSENRSGPRRIDSYNILDMYLKKLQRDVFEIIRDLKAIKEALGTKRLPKDLALLLRSMNHYVKGQGKLYLKNYAQQNNLRRTWAETSDTKIKRIMIDLLEICDKEIGDQDSLNQLTYTTKGIVERVVKQNQIDDFANVGLKISNPAYTLTKDLKSIGSKWPEMSDNFLNSPPTDKIYHIKLLHLMVTVDVNKIEDAIKLLSFAQNRRANLDTTSSEQEMIRVQNDINNISTKIQQHFQKIDTKIEVPKEKNDTVMLEVPSRRKSFLKQIKRLFKDSRRDIRNMLHKKVSKSNIVKELAKNKLDELAKNKMVQYENTLKKWQNKLKVRTKRSGDYFRKSKDRMTNILPSYLRGKVNPAIKQSKMKQTKRSKKYRHGYNSSRRQATTIKSNNRIQPKTTTRKMIIDKRKENTVTQINIH